MPGSFENFRGLPAMRDAEMRMFWSTIDDSLMAPQIAHCSKSYGMAPFLQTLLDMGGFDLPKYSPDFYPSSNKEPVPTKGLPWHDAIVAVGNAACIENAYDNGGLDKHVRHQVSPEFREFHRSYCANLLNDHAGWVETTVPAMDPSCHPFAKQRAQRTLASALAVAATLDDDVSVRALVAYDPRLMHEEHPLSILGDMARAYFPAHPFGPQQQEDVKPKDRLTEPTINAFACAMQFSAANAMQAMLEAGFPSTLPLGSYTKGGKDDRIAFDLSSVSRVLTPGCKEDVYEGLIASRVESGDKKERKAVFDGAVQLLWSETSQQGEFSKQYLPALLRAGAFNHDPAQALECAAKVGRLDVVNAMLDRIDIESIMPIFGATTGNVNRIGDDLVSHALTRSGEPYISKIDQCIENIIQRATHSASDQTPVIEQSQSTPGLFLTVDSMLRSSLLRTLTASLNAGLDVDALKPEWGHTPLTGVAQSMDNGSADILLAHKARGTVNELLASLDANKKVNSFSTR